MIALGYRNNNINQRGENHSSFLVSTRWCVMAVFLCDVTQCCGKKIRGNESMFSSRYQLGILPKPMQSLPGVTSQICHDACIKDERAHHFVQFSKEFFLFFGKLFSLVPNFCGIEEVGCNLDIACCHLVDFLWNGHRRTTC